MAVFLAVGVAGLGAGDGWAQSGAGPAASTNTVDAADAGFANLLQALSLASAQIEQTVAVRLLEELAKEHAAKAEDATRSGRPERAGWESELARSLRERAALVAKSFGGLAGPLSAVTNRLGSLRATNDFTSDEVAYLGALDARLTAIRQQCDAALEEGRAITLQLGQSTNSMEVARVSAMLQDNFRQVGELQREQFDFELKVLEYRALRSRRNPAPARP